MDLTPYLPIASVIGVIAGWTLNEFSSRFRDSAATKRTLSKTITHLIIFHDEIESLARTLKKVKKQADGNEAYEAERVRLVNRNLLSSETFVQQFDICIQEIAAISPVDAVELHHMKDVFVEYKKLNFTESSSNPSIYGDMLSSIDQAYELYEKKLNAIALRLAWKRGLMTWVRIKLLQREHEKKIKLTEPQKENFYKSLTERNDTTHEQAGTEQVVGSKTENESK